MRWTIRRQIMFPLLAVAMVGLVAVGVVNAVLVERRISDQVEQRLRQVVEVLSSSSFPLTNVVLRQMRDLASAEFVLVNESGAVAASTLDSATFTTTPLSTENVVVRLQDVRLGPSRMLAEGWYFHTPVRLPIGSATTRTGTLHVLFPQDEYRRAWREAFVPSLGVGVVIALALAIVTLALTNRMTRTIARLREEVERIARGDFRQAPLPAVNDEIRDLSVAINQTAAMLADYEQQVRRSEQMRTVSILGASIAHQLRNAVTGCRMALDLYVAEQSGFAAEPHDHPSSGTSHECLEVAKRQLQLMESQLQRFLRVGKRPSQIAKREFDLRGMVEELLPLVRPAAAHAGVALECHLPGHEITVHGDKEALGHALLNILLNAVEAAQRNAIGREPASRVLVELLAYPTGMVELIVSDTGTGPPTDVAQSLFEPFVTDKPEGAGLGLAVAHEVVAAHNGVIVWDRHSGMTRFHVSIPPSGGVATPEQQRP
ncbi:MAG: HAMP domain-containing protein [Pirellulales bacterium]|nr:HAMP domain-containing protein [Pirellulales bacterium]